ncbi:MAG: hypothetical protein IPO60_12210 [Flavobacteriales bacterium]|nr:hypothetical protein [Flavobacteriales bacterium]
MSDIELKKRLINRIQRTRDSTLLREAYRLMGTDAADLEPHKLSKEEQASIDKGKRTSKKAAPSASAKPARPLMNGSENSLGRECPAGAAGDPRLLARTERLGQV